MIRTGVDQRSPITKHILRSVFWLAAVVANHEYEPGGG